ncbi:sensor histidine kinase [Bradyrhizobium genosp. P]|uniref:sensor histidine kinase n=1 Tax=Bradyrhizobium genosp. P TaxID=83641 RepID=UPI003CF66274
MPWVDALSDPTELRKCIRDLIAVSTLPASWKNHQPQQIADSVATGLLSMLDADFVCVLLDDDNAGYPIEVTRSRNATDESVSIWKDVLFGARIQRFDRLTTIAVPSTHIKLNAASAPIGFPGQSMVVAGSFQVGFPSQKQRLLLGIAANDATIALSRWQTETEARRLANIIERSSDFIGFAAMDGIPQYINAAGREIIGFPGSEIPTTLRIYDFLVEADRRRARETLMPAVISDGRWRGELNFRHFETGHVIPFLVDWFRTDDPRTGQPVNLAMVSRDLREQKKLERDLRRTNEELEQRVAERTAELRQEIAERERSDARARLLQQELLHASRLSVAGQMAGAIAHEINQPLTALANSVNAARRMMANERSNGPDITREIMDEAAELALRTGGIIGRLRQFVSGGEMEMRIERLSVLIQDATDFTLVGSGARNARVQFDFDPRAERVLVDRVQVQQLLVNLLRNAVEAIAGSKRQELKISTSLINAEMVQVAITDNGLGLPDEIASHLFEAFRSTKRDGMGLGLMICRSIVEAHAGALSYEPNPAGGATFRFTLPVVPNEEQIDQGKPSGR